MINNIISSISSFFFVIDRDKSVVVDLNMYHFVTPEFGRFFKGVDVFTSFDTFACHFFKVHKFVLQQK